MYGAVIFVILNLYYLISDLARDFYLQPHTWLNCVAILLMIITGVFVIIQYAVPKLRKNQKLLRGNVLLFYSGIIIAVALFSYTNNVRAMESGADATYIGIMLSTLYLIIIMICPMPELSDSIYLLVLETICTIIVMVAPGNEYFSLIKQLSLRFVFIAGYIYIRSKNIKASKEEVKLMELNTKLTSYSYIDQLTNALNRHAFNKYIESFKMSKMTLGIVLFDVDNFKSYNDTYSHDAGDVALKRIASAVFKVLDDDDRFLFRYGGEEFVLLIRNADEEKLITKSSKYIQAVNDENIFRKDIKEQNKVTISIGCDFVEVIDNDYQIEEAFKSADRQLYKDKNSNKCCLCINNKIYR